jgi:hypothetical protein
MVDTIPITDLYVAGRLTADQESPNKVSVARDLDFSGPSSYELDFTTVNQDKVFGIIKSMFLDNTDNPSEIVVSVSSTQQKFTIPAFSEGYFSIIAAQQSRVRLDSDGGATSTITAVFHNWFIAPQVWYKNGNNPSGGVLDVEGPNADGADLDAVSNTNPVLIAGVDRADNKQHTISVDATGKINVNDATPISVSVDTNGAVTDRSAAMTGVSLQIMAANANRRFLYIRNDAATEAAIIFGAGPAVIDGLGSITLKEGNSVQFDSMFCPVEAVQAIGTALANLTAYEG